MNLPTATELAEFDLLTVDVFDTLLRRRPVCERRRLRRVAHAAANHPSLRAFDVDSAALLWARQQAKRLAYRVVAIDDPPRDVRLCDLLVRVARLLGLPQEAADILARIEIEEEIRSVVLNAGLVAWLRKIRAQGTRIVALSDTHYSAQQLGAVLKAARIGDVCDAIYTSADLGYTKRGGRAFTAVAERERVRPSRIAHLGDDELADGAAPQLHGIQAFVTPRPLWLRALHAFDAACFALATRLGRVPRPRAIDVGKRDAAREQLGRKVFGPVVAEYGLQLWLYLSSIPCPDEAVALFCTRGGLRMRRAFERALDRLGLPLPVRTGDLMVSRLIAARGALLRSPAYGCEELAREFKHSTAAQVVHALATQPLELGEAWNTPFDAVSFLALIDHDPAGAQLMHDLHEQNVLFDRHVEQLAAGARRLVLCDTGLFASTQRSLEKAFPERHWESVLFARCNYRDLDAPHFARTTGLVVQRDAYTPFEARSSILRYWHLVESLFEPPLESVRRFAASADGRVRANIEQDGWEQSLAGAPGSFFAGVLDYLDTLRPGDTDRIVAEAEAGWAYLRQAIRFPTQEQISLLVVDERSRDFGTDQAVPVVARGRRRPQLGRVRQALWREAYLAQAVPAFQLLAHLLWEGAYIARLLSTHFRSHTSSPTLKPTSRGL